MPLDLPDVGFAHRSSLAARRLFRCALSTVRPLALLFLVTGDGSAPLAVSHNPASGPEETLVSPS